MNKNWPFVLQRKMSKANFDLLPLKTLEFNNDELSNYNKKMILGYIEMGNINIDLSELGFTLDVSSLEYYEGKMADCE